MVDPVDKDAPLVDFEHVSDRFPAFKNRDADRDVTAPAEVDCYRMREVLALRGVVVRIDHGERNRMAAQCALG